MGRDFFEEDRRRATSEFADNLSGATYVSFRPCDKNSNFGSRDETDQLAIARAPPLARHRSRADRSLVGLALLSPSHKAFQSHQGSGF